MTLSRNPVVLIVEDDAGERAVMAKILRHGGYTVEEAETGRQGMDRILSGGIDILLTDFRLPEMDGVELLRSAKSAEIHTEVILISGFGTVEVAVEAIREGAFDFISKPVRKAQLLAAVDKAAEKRRLAQVGRQSHTLSDERGFRRFVYASPQMCQIAQVIERAAPTSTNVLIVGEAGSGKETIAGAIHTSSQRRDAPFVKVSCGSLPESLLDIELFGSEKTPSAPPYARRKGQFDVAHGGTLYLDEIGATGPRVQVKLLRFLESGRFERVGGARGISADVRILAASNRDLIREVRDGQFREDLFYRLNVINICIPPLRERKEDIPVLSLHFLTAYAGVNNKSIDGFSEDAMTALLAHGWPGNVHELENAIERSVVLTNSRIISANVLLDGLSPSRDTRDSLSFKIGTPLHECQRQAIEFTLQHTRGDKNIAARLLGVATRTIYRHIARREQEVIRGIQDG